MARTAMAKKKKHSSFMGFVLVAMVVMLISIIIFLQGRETKSKLDAYIAQDERYDELIEEEKKRSEAIDEFEKETQTKGYAAEKARESLGLVQEGEIIFKKDN
jgi:cell division protein DivIC